MHRYIGRTGEPVDSASRSQFARRSLASRSHIACKTFASRSQHTQNRTRIRSKIHSKSSPNRLNSFPNSPKSPLGPQKLRDAPQRSPKSLPGPAKSSPRTSQERPRPPQESPKSPPRLPKWAPRGLPRRTGELLGTILRRPNSKQTPFADQLLRDLRKKCVGNDFSSISHSCAKVSNLIWTRPYRVEMRFGSSASDSTPLFERASQKH